MGQMRGKLMVAGRTLILSKLCSCLAGFANLGSLFCLKQHGISYNP
jgi:hypothetical protein